MKKSLILVLLLLSLTSYQQQSNNSSKYIEFSHTGIEDKYERPLLISLTKLDISLTNDELKRLRHLLGKSVITKKEKEEYLRSIYQFIITDKITYLAVLNFISTHKELYTNKLNKNNGEFEDYEIKAEGQKYSIFYKFTYKFFKELVVYLQEKNRDKKLINAINGL